MEDALITRWTTAMVVSAVLTLSTPVTTSAEPMAMGKDFSKPAVVILGYGLKPDGSMRDKLYQRVATGRAIANMFPNSFIIVTGGNPQNGVSEAEQMRNMLVGLGYPSDRIVVEPRANSTVQNAQFSVPLAKQAGASGIILVTNSTHQQRADRNFADAGGNVLATASFPDGNAPTNIGQFMRDIISPFR
ncbi:YdcF family protein [Mycobacteroides salmoniphilum]|nr:YdcF family protein [Mycobacteroides salmoniphilum]